MTVRRPAAAPSPPAEDRARAEDRAPVERVVRETLAASSVEADTLSPRLLRSVTDHVSRAIARQVELDRYRRGR